LFFDEIGEIDPATQVKLLRFLGERTFERVGSNKTLSADVRLVAATNKNLAGLVREGTFREDLYFRLRVVEIQMPPLRERKNDIPLLARAFLQEFADENSKHVTGISGEAMDVLVNYTWPGNVRELRTAIEHAVVLARSPTIEIRDLPQNIRIGDDKDLGSNSLSGELTVKEAEKQLIIRALKETTGNRSEAAKRIGMSRRTLHRKLHTYQLENL
jgi:two-component system, NtrC family, response regulator AtoC